MKRQVSKCRMILLVNSLEVFLCVLTAVLNHKREKKIQSLKIPNCRQGNKFNWI